MTVLAGVLAAVLYGVGDYIAGSGARATGDVNQAGPIALLATIVGTLASGAFLVVSDAWPMELADLAWILSAGVALSAARPLLYRGMAVGPVTVFGPVFGLVSIAVPVALDVVMGEELEAVEILGVGIALPAITLISSNQGLPSLRDLTTSRTVGMAAVVGATVGTGAFLLSQASSGTGPASAFVVAAAGVFIIPVVGKVVGLPVRGSMTILPIGLVVGCTSIVAVALTAFALQRGGAAVGAALIGLSPGVSALLAWALRGEAVNRLQLVGGGLGVTSVALIAIA